MQIEDPAVHMLRITDPREGVALSRVPTMLANGRNSLYQAINLAALAGARLEVLLGADGKLGADGQKHSAIYGEHPDKTPDASDLEVNRKHFRALAAELAKDGVEVLNASPGTAIDAFAKADLERALGH